ncbi:hypothetical protein OQA88_5192 [Cercophora sp. LCS_1]
MAVKHLITFLSTIVVPISAAPAEAAKGPLGTSFNFYAWGNGIPGLRLFYDDGAAVFTDYETASSTPNLIPVALTFTTRQNSPVHPKMGYSFTAQPDLAAPMTPNAAMLSPPFTSATFFVGNRPSSESPDSHEVGFAPLDAASTTAVRVGGFMIVDRRFSIVEDDGLVKSSVYCAFPRKDNPRIWEVKWNVTNDGERADGLPVTLRTGTYPKDTKAEFHFGTRCGTMI